MGARKGLDLRTIIQQFHSRGARIYQEGASAPPRPLNETLSGLSTHLLLRLFSAVASHSPSGRCQEGRGTSSIHQLYQAPTKIQKRVY